MRDESRRTIVGTGKVLVARKPFKVFAWVDRGYYRVGDTVKAHFQAQTLDSKPVEGKGELTLLQDHLQGSGGTMEPIETPVRRWEVDTNDEGLAEQQMRAAAKGQYRLSYELTDTAGHKIEGGYVFTIVGDGFDGEGLPLQRPRAHPEQEASTSRRNGRSCRSTRTARQHRAAVRAADQRRLSAAEGDRLKGKSDVEEIEVGKKDMPNFFVEAVTVGGGKVYEKAKEIVVPPEKRVLNVEVLPTHQEYKPGEKAKVKVKLTDFAGKPFVGARRSRCTTRRSSTSPAARTCRDQGVLLEVAAAPPAEPRVEPGAILRQHDAAGRDGDGLPRHVRRLAGVGCRFDGRRK